MNSAYRKNFITHYKKQLMTVVLLWIGCFVLFLFAYILLLSPQNNVKDAVEQKLAKTKQAYQSAVKATQEETRNELKEEIEQLKDKLDSYIIGFGDAADLTFDITRIASDAKISTFSIKNKNSGVLNIGDCKYIGENQFDIGFTASFEQFTTFLSALERHRPVVFVDEFTMSRSTQDKNITGNRVNMSVAVFVRKQQGSL